MTFHTPKFGFCSAFGGGSGGMPGLLGPNLGSIFLGEGTAGHKWLKTSIASTLMQHFQGGYLYGNDAFSYEPLDYLNGTPLIDAFFGIADSPSERTSKLKYNLSRHVGRRWLLLMDIYKDPEKRKEVFGALSLSQTRSLHLLMEWYTGQYDDPRFPNEAWGMLAKLYPLDGLSAYLKKLSSDEWCHRYHAVLFKLFLQEIGSLRESQELQILRCRAAEAAACQKLGYLYITLQVIPTCSNQPAQTPQGTLRQRVTATIEPCIWLNPGERKKGLPYYIWDTEHSTTQVVHNPHFDLDYVVISHTWGRWKVEPESLARIDGVPWEVPENKRFDVHQIPAMLGRLGKKLGIRYVWLDLFCIPQDGCWKAKEEISRQAEIFFSARQAVIWFNDVSSWAELQTALRWLALDFLLHSGDYAPEFLEFLKEQRERLPKCLSTELLNGSAPCGWFTSLWTLQEACLRPDMWLLNDKWELLTVDNSTPVSLDCIAALSSASKRMCKETKLALIEGLRKTLELANMQKIQELDPASILQLASGRHCRRNRGEAIMSVLGVTKWYKEKLDRGENYQENTILGEFPFDFLQEVRKRFGGLFFATRSDTSDYFKILTPETGKLGPVGTLLPFSSCGTSNKRSHPSASAMRIDNPAVKAWELRRDGSVKMGDVGIVFSAYEESYSFTDLSSPGSHADITARIYYSIKKLCWGKAADVGELTMGLQEWMQTCFPGEEKHAVIVSQYEGRKIENDGKFVEGGGDGFILKRVLKGRSVWGKIADFIVISSEVPSHIRKNVWWTVY